MGSLSLSVGTTVGFNAASTAASDGVAAAAAAAGWICGHLESCTTVKPEESSGTSLRLAIPQEYREKGFMRMEICGLRGRAFREKTLKQ